MTQLMRRAHIDQADIRAVDGGELTVKELTELRRFCYQSPGVSRHKLLLITNADRLRREVANALLKLIEEPPPHLLIRLSALTLAAVLPTIRSRCQLVFAGTKLIMDDRFPLAKIDLQTITEQFALADQLAHDDHLEAIIVSWLQALEAQLLRGDHVSARIHAAQRLLERTRTNANRRVALEAWFLNSRGDTTADSFTDRHG